MSVFPAPLGVFVKRTMLIFTLVSIPWILTASPINTADSIVNPWKLSLNERIWNRKHISHMVLEARKDHYRLTLLVAERFPYNYKGKSSPLFLRFDSAKSAMDTAELWDKFLETGEEVYVQLNGSEIQYWKFLK